MPSEAHRVFIINHEGEAPFVEPKVLPVQRGDQVLFVVAGEEGEFAVRPDTNLFQSISAAEDIPVEVGSPQNCTIRQGVSPNSVHTYEVFSDSRQSIDPMVVIYE